MSTQIFARHAQTYASHGLRVFPCGGESGKKPVIKGWRNVGLKAVDELARKFPDSNIGFIDGGPGGVTRVDIDDPSKLDDCLKRFGNTPIIFGTPSGGYHLCYRANGEGRYTRFEGEHIDILGAGGFGVAPPSVSPSKGQYKFLQGSIADLDRLPIAKGLRAALNAPKKAIEACNDKALANMKGGDGRNIHLFDQGRWLAKNAKDEDQLLDMMLTINKRFAEPLDVKELQCTARQIWQYKIEGRLLLKGCAATGFVTADEFELIGSDPYAIQLLTKLRIAHGWCGGGWFFIANALAESLDINRKTMRKALARLAEVGLIEILERSQKGKKGKTRARLL